MRLASAQEVSVRGRDGLIGMIDAALQPEDDSEVWISLNNGQVLRVPADLLVPLKDGSYYLPMNREQVARAEGSGEKAAVMVIPVVQEDLTVTKQEKTRAVVRVHKNVKEREERVDETGFIEHVSVERIPKNEEVASPPEAHYEGDTLVIPVLEEVLVVEKRLILKEEVRVTRLREETRTPQNVKLRSEEVKVERIETGSEKSTQEDLNSGRLGDK